ncbi:MAG: tripartite tricarboxylate transporter substrate binding protein [Spirochaetes bacterium]|nr:MAG: tripartite tricarboxylate transporter substrate binding protein [Spirochaetota bacterium]
MYNYFKELIMKKLVIAVLLVAMLSVSLFANGNGEGAEASFPTKPIHLIVYTGAGGAGDILSRKFVDIASKYTDATFVVENKAGAGGIVAMEYVKSIPADGYTLMYVTKSNISKIAGASEMNPTEEFDWIAMMQIDPECVITNNKTDIVTWEQVVADAKAKDGKQLWLGPAAGGLDNVTAERIWKAAGIKATWVPFASGGKAKAALLGKQGVTYTGNPGEIIGKPDFSVAAVCLDERLPQFPDVPTFKELGVLGVENEIIWRGFAVKKGTTDAVIAWYDDLFEKVSKDEDWIATYAPKGNKLVHYTKDKFNKIVAEDYKGYLEAFGK